MSEELSDALAKIERAESQIEDLNREIWNFIQSRPYRIVAYKDADHHGMSGNMTTIVGTRGVILSLGPRTGRHFIRDKDGNLTQERHEAQPRTIILGENDIRIGFDTAEGFEDDFEFATTTADAQLETDFQPTFEISLWQVSGVRREPIAAQLIQMRDLAQSIFLTFQRRFFPDVSSNSY